MMTACEFQDGIGMTDDRKRNTGGEVERYEPEIVPDPDKPYIHFHYDPEGRWMLYRDHNRALAESRAEAEALRASMVGDAANHVAIERDHHKARAERLAGALSYVLNTHIATGDDGADAANKARAALNLEPTP